MTTQTAEIGSNKTGIGTSPALSDDMIQGTMEFPPSTPGDEREIARVREDYSKDADPLGTVPPPMNLKGVMKTAASAIKGEHPTLFLDKLGERLAFERSGVRLYEALLSKFDAFGNIDHGPARAELERILEQEFQHFRLLEEAVTSLGGDPTVVTPSADIQATITKGVVEVLVDPRTNFLQSLEAILVAELADNDCWDTLTQLAVQAGENDLATRFRIALSEEREHLINVRSWIAAAQDRVG